ncbi:neuropeptide Y receptor type 2 [Drosophila obscura]|uniref:neuropeptide Y receptor type 2 n=1 Tax=Drosophila obscura TaxID=7282 RepID=UPI001BB20B0B|nr:neuropeptide Y receptor type 2 [Drosophila obscura]
MALSISQLNYVGSKVAHVNLAVSSSSRSSRPPDACNEGGDTSEMTATNATSSEFDFSKWDFPAERIWLHKSNEEIAWKICTFVPLIGFGLYGNCIMIYLIAVNKSLRSPTNLIIANMAVADLLTLSICPAMFMVNDFYQNYQLGCVGCRMEGFLVVVFLITAVLNLSVVSYDRLTAIVLPRETRLTVRGAQIVIVCTWIGGVLLASPLALYRAYRVRVWKNFTERYCKENTDVLPKYWYVLITILVWLPLGIMLICYIAIFYKLDRYEKRVQNRENPLTVSYKRSVAKTLFIVVVVFAVLRLPFTILVVLREKYYSADTTVNSGMQLFWYLSQYLMFLNAAVNPLIYGFNNENFRRAYYHISCVRRRREAAKLKESSRRQHHCCYCAFMKKKRQQQQQQEEEVQQQPKNVEVDLSKEITTSEPLARIGESSEDVAVAEIEAEGFI